MIKTMGVSNIAPTKNSQQVIEPSTSANSKPTTTSQIAAIPGISSAIRPVRRQQPGVTTTRRQILELLAEYHYLTTEQIWRHLQSDKKIPHTRRELVKLRDDLKLVRSFAIEPEAGAASPYCWVLTRRGVEDELGQEYTPDMVRKPTRQRIYFQEVRLAVERQVRAQAGWELVKPQNFNPHHFKPKDGGVTMQYQQVIKGLSYLSGIYHPNAIDSSGQRIGISILASAVRLSERLAIHTSQLQTSNDYVAYLETGQEFFAVPLIICPPGAGRDFWKERAALYHPICSLGVGSKMVSQGRRLLAFGVFETSEQTSQYKLELAKYGLEVATAGKLSRALVWARQQLATRYQPI